MKVTLLSKEEKQEYMDMQACYKAIKKARIIRRNPAECRVEGVTHTNIPMSMWDVLQPVIEVESED